MADWPLSENFAASVVEVAHTVPWMPGIAVGLARSKWDSLATCPGLLPSSYSTSRVLAGSALERRYVTAEICLPAAFGNNVSISVERLECADAYESIGLKLCNLQTDGEIAAVVNRLSSAFETIAAVPSLAATMGSVLSAVHVLQTPGPDYDVSYSDPAIPFSAFVGVPEADGRVANLRLVEGLVHEAMHLQLTLLEGMVPLVAGGAERHWSPWQQTGRPTRGVLHGFYVFTVLDAFFDRLCLQPNGVDGNAHLVSRKLGMAPELAHAAGSLAKSRELTPCGRGLLAAMAKRLAAA